MKKYLFFGLLMIMLMTLCCANAELSKEQTEVYVDGVCVDVQVYSDGQKKYVDLEQLITLLGGTYQEEQGKIVIGLCGAEAQALPSAAAETPAVSWEYLNYWIAENVGYAHVEEWMQDCYYGADDQRQLVTDMINAAIEKTKNVEKFVKAFESLVYSGGYATNAMEALGK